MDGVKGGSTAGKGRRMASGVKFYKHLHPLEVTKRYKLLADKPKVIKISERCFALVPNVPMIDYLYSYRVVSYPHAQPAEARTRIPDSPPL